MIDKKEIEDLIKKEKYEQAHNKISEFVEEKSTIDNYIFAEKIYKKLFEKIKFVKLKVALLRSITIESMIPILKVKAYKNKINPEIYLGQYNIIDQEILDVNSLLYNFAPDVLIIFSRIDEMAPKLLESFINLSEKEVEQEINNVITRLDDLFKSFRKKSKAKVIIHNFKIPQYPEFGIADSVNKKGQKKTFERLNNRLEEITKRYDDIYVLDYDQLTSRFGKENFFDEKLWYTSKAPVSKIGLENLADEYIRYLIPISGLTKKCLVLDLDNTLWGGVLGEEGVEGIDLGHSSPGNAFLDFQKEILKLYHKGFILAINSKNNERDVMEVFEKHPYMALKKEHFASMKINWKNKAENMKEIENELNIDLNTFVFFDDNPIERELIKTQFPQIHTIDLPKNPHLYPKKLKKLPDFEMLSFSDEDMKRGKMYYEQIQRKKLKESSSSLDDFYISLEMKAVISLNDSFSLPRLTKMTQKTNQFNLTTIRYSNSDIKNFMDSKNHRIYSLQLFDKFGDNGIVGEIIIKEEKETWIIDSFILSCRVIGRTVETAFLSYIIKQARAENIKFLIGKFIPTKKNLPVKDLYKKHNFNFVKKNKNENIWRLDIQKKDIKCPEWINITDK